MACRKRVDFYIDKGQWVARSWPRYRGYTPSAAELLTRQRFAASARVTGAASPALRELTKAWMAGSVGVTWVDFNRAMSRPTGKWVGKSFS